MKSLPTYQQYYFTFFSLLFFVIQTLSAQDEKIKRTQENSSQYTGPVIDMHLHAYSKDNYWGGKPHPTGVSSPKSAEEHLRLTISQMKENNIKKAVIDVMSIHQISALSNPRFLVGYNDMNPLISVAEFEKQVRAGNIKVFGEVTAVYQGKTLNDPMYAPYLKICEKYGIPVAYHTGGGPPMTPYTCCPEFRISKGDPLLIEDVLVKYPNLKIYLMHGGEVFFEHAVRMMSLYRQLYIGIGVLTWVDPITKDYAVRLLQLAKEAGNLNRVMFGTDQMVWPEAISLAINFVNDLTFLSKEEKANIFYNNAARFLELSEEEIAAHHQ